MPIQPKQQPPYYTQTNNIKQYRALLNQTSTNTPTTIILDNSLDNTPIYTYNSTGNYSISSTDFADYEKLIILIGTPQNAEIQYIIEPETNGITLKVWSITNTDFTDDELINTSIQILKYP